MLSAEQKTQEDPCWGILSVSGPMILREHVIYIQGNKVVLATES